MAGFVINRYSFKKGEIPTISGLGSQVNFFAAQAAPEFFLSGFGF